MSRASEPAYPGEMWPEQSRPPVGLTIREHFAAICLQGLLANSDTVGTTENYALSAVEQADALIAALSQGEPK